jgi:hypothetical protein
MHRKNMRAHPILQMVMNRAHLQIHRFDRAKCPLQRVQAERPACDGWCFGPDRCVCAHAHQTAGAPAGCFEPRLVAPQLIAGCARSISASGGFLRMAVRPPPLAELRAAASTCLPLLRRLSLSTHQLGHMKRHFAQELASCSSDGIGNGRGNRRNARFANACGGAA